MKRLSYILLAAAGGLEFIFVMAQLQYWTNKDFTDQHFTAIQPLVRIGSNYPSIHYVAVAALLTALAAVVLSWFYSNGVALWSVAVMAFALWATGIGDYDNYQQGPLVTLGVVALICAITVPFGFGDRLRAHRLYKRPVVEDYVPTEPIERDSRLP